MKTVVIKNDAFKVLSKSTGLAEDILENRILTRLKKIGALSKRKSERSNRRKSFEFYAIKLNLQVFELLEKVFFKDEISYEVAELVKSVYVTRIKTIEPLKFKKLKRDIPFFEVVLDWDNGIGRVDNKMVELEFGNVLLRFDIDVFEERESRDATHSQPSESSLVSQDAEIKEIEIYVNDEIRLVTNKMFNSVSEILLKNLETN